MWVSIGTSTPKGLIDNQPLSKFEVICNVILVSSPCGDEVLLLVVSLIRHAPIVKVK